MKRPFELKEINNSLDKLSKRVDALLEYFTMLFLSITGESFMQTKETTIPITNKEIVDASSKSVETSDQKIIRLENQVNRLEQLLQTALTKIDDQARDIKYLKQQVEIQSITIKEKNRVIDELNEKLNLVMEDNKQLREENKQLREENKQLREENRQLLEENRQLLEENRQLREDNKMLKGKEDQAEIMRMLEEELSCPRNDVSCPVLVINTGDKIQEDEIERYSDSTSVPVTRRDLGTNFWNPFSGTLDTLFYGMPCRQHKKNQEEIKWLAHEGHAGALEETIKSKRVDVNGRGMPDSLCAIVKGFFEKTPLILAAARGHLKCVSVLLKTGAHTNLYDRNGWTALDHAKKNGHSDVEYILRLHNGLSGSEIEKNGPIPSQIISMDPVSTPKLAMS